jgi:predicted RNA-binding protein YlxR (DUF448 family)
MIAAPQDTDIAALDRGPHQAERTRMCAATRTVQPVSDLIRFVVAPDGAVVADVKGKLPGRGIWVIASREALLEAIKRNAFARGFEREVRLPSDFVERTERLLERAVLDALAILGKAGRVVTGFAKTEAALEHGEVLALLHAAGAAADGTRKLDAVWHRRRPGTPSVVIGFLNGAQLDLALGRPNVVHAALLAGPASDTCLSRLRRLGRFRTADSGDRGDTAGAAAAR